MTISDLTHADLEDALEVIPPDAEDNRPQLRWYITTPFCRVLKATEDDMLIGYGNAICFGDSGWITELIVHPRYRRKGIGTALANALLAHLEAEGCDAQRVITDPEFASFFGKLGFAEEGALLKYSGGKFYQATRDEPTRLEPEHVLGVLHHDRRATGEDRRSLIMDQLYLGTVYMEEKRMRGILLMMNGPGLIIADEPEIGFELLRWMFPLIHTVTAPAANTAVHAHLTGLKYTAEPAGLRLLRGTPHAPWRPETIYAGGGWG